MIYAAGGCSTWEDEEDINAFGGENWEMDTQLNVNFVFGLDKNNKIFINHNKTREAESEENKPISLAHNGVPISTAAWNVSL